MKTLKDIRERFDDVVHENFTNAVNAYVVMPPQDEAPERAKKLQEALKRRFVKGKDKASREEISQALKNFDVDESFDAEEKKELHALRLESKIASRDMIRGALVYYYGSTAEGKLQLMRSPHADRSVEEAVDLLMVDVDLWINRHE